MKKIILSFLSISLGTQLPAQEPLELPVTKVVLFSSGVGFFEHRGQVTGDGLVRLNLSTDQINDVLKSLLLRDEGGSVSSVNFPSQDPLDRALSSFSVDLSSKPSLATLLDQVRGAEVEVSTPQKLTGRILGVETRLISGRDGEGLQEVFLNLFTGEEVISIAISSLGGLKFKDPKISQDLGRALKLILESSDTLRKALDIRFTGQGKRNVSLGYIVEAPVWKTSYRLDLSGAKPYIQGWAVVENTTDQDWKNINLSLVSGRPVSFIQDLYSPLYLPRPVVAPSVQSNLKPQSYGGGIESRGPGGPPPSPAMAPQMKSRMFETPSPESSDDFAAEGALGDLRGSSVIPQASGTAAGELFQFMIKGPVTLPRRTSSLLPLVGADIQAEKVSIYNAQVHASRPYNGAWITNTTGLKLPAGPMTVLDAQVYAGDALMDNLVEKDRRLISYGLDLNTLVDSTSTSTLATTGVKLLKGVLTFTRMVTFTKTYLVQNKGMEPRTLVIEHPVEGGRTLLEPSSYEEKTLEYYRFKFLVSAATQGSLMVKETLPRVDRVTLVNSDSQSFLSYITSGDIPPTIKRSLEKARDLKAVDEDLQTQQRLLAGKKTELEGEQGRIRSNIASVGRDSVQGKRYLEKLMETEAALDALTLESEDLRKRLGEAKKAYENYLNTLDL